MFNWFRKKKRVFNLCRRTSSGVEVYDKNGQSWVLWSQLLTMERMQYRSDALDSGIVLDQYLDQHEIDLAEAPNNPATICGGELGQDRPSSPDVSGSSDGGGGSYSGGSYSSGD